MSRTISLVFIRGIIALALALQALAVFHSPAEASAAPVNQVAAAQATTYKRHIAMRFALSKAGGYYRYGGNGPSSYDCSGLTMAAYAKAGISLPRIASQQRYSNKTVPVSLRNARWGDLVFWGTGHVEFFSSRIWSNGRLVGFKSYGAHKSGTTISYRKNYLTSSYTKQARIEYVSGAGPR